MLTSVSEGCHAHLDQHSEAQEPARPQEESHADLEGRRDLAKWSWGEEPSREGAPWPQKAVNRGEQREGLQCGVCRESWGGGPKPWGPSQCRARSD